MATSGKKERHVLTCLWKIENMSFYDRGIHGVGIWGPTFRTRNRETAWRFLLFPMGKNEEDKHFHMSLKLWSSPHFGPIDVEWSILGLNGSSLFTGTERYTGMNLFDSVSMPDCPTHEEVFVTRKSEFLPNNNLTVRCRIWKSEGNFPRSETFFIRSQLEVFQDSFEWLIEAFGRLVLQREVTFKEYVFLSGVEILFKFVFSLTGSSLEEAVARIELVSLRIQREVSATLKVSVLDNEQKSVKSVEVKHVFGKSGESQILVLPPIAMRRELLSRQSDCLSGDVLTLLCEITAVGENIWHSVTKTNLASSDLRKDVGRSDSICSDASCQTDVARSDFICSDASCQTDAAITDSICSETSCKSEDTLREDFLSLYRDQSGSDFELRSGDVSFPVHKQVLMARSPVFRAMFCSDMRESGTHSLDVPDVDAHTLNRMLTFLYAGTVDPDLQWEDAAKLYYAADKYQVQSLKQRCSSVLQSGLSVSNVSDVLTLADRHQDQELTSFVHDFFLRRFDDIMFSDEWDSFLKRNPILAGTTLNQVCKKKLQITRSQ